MTSTAWRVELELEPSRHDPLGDAAQKSLAARGFSLAHELRVGRGYLLPGALTAQQVAQIVGRVLADPVNEVSRIIAPGQVDTDGDATLLVRRANRVVSF